MEKSIKKENVMQLDAENSLDQQQSRFPLPLDICLGEISYLLNFQKSF